MNRVTLTRFLIDEQYNHHSVPADLRLLLEVVSRAIKAISINVGKGALAGVLGDAGAGSAAINVQGEAQKKLDVIANEILLEANEWGGHLAAMASEEMEKPHAIPHRYPKGEYLLLFDPLDGSSNIDVNVSVGTIFSVLRCPEGVTEPLEKDFLQPGRDQVCAGFAVYGPSTVLVLTLGTGVHAFTLDRELGSFMLTQENIRIPEDTKEFAINMSNMRFWEPPMQRYIGELLAGKTGAARQGLQHALDRLDGGGCVPHPHARRHLPVSEGWQGPFQAGPVAPHVRGEPDGVHHRAGGRRRDHRP